MKTVTYDETQWKLVPVEPTEHMIDMGEDQHTCVQEDAFYADKSISEYDCLNLYKAMLAAAYEAPELEDTNIPTNGISGPSFIWTTFVDVEEILATSVSSKPSRGRWANLTGARTVDNPIPLYVHPSADAKDAARYEYILDCEVSAARAYITELDEIDYKARCRAMHDRAIENTCATARVSDGLRRLERNVIGGRLGLIYH